MRVSTRFVSVHRTFLLNLVFNADIIFNPLLMQMNNVNLLHLVIDIESGTSTLEHTYTLYDTRYRKPQVTVSNSISGGWKRPLANWVMDIETPSTVYFQNYTALYCREVGLQFFYETSQDSSFSDLLDFTEISK